MVLPPIKIGTSFISNGLLILIADNKMKFVGSGYAKTALADKGQQVVIRRRGKVSYMLTPVYDDDFVLSPEAEKRLEESRRQYREGNVTTFTTKEDLNRFLEKL